MNRKGGLNSVLDLIPNLLIGALVILGIVAIIIPVILYLKIDKDASPRYDHALLAERINTLPQMEKYDISTQRVTLSLPNNYKIASYKKDADAISLGAFRIESIGRAYHLQKDPRVADLPGEADRAAYEEKRSVISFPRPDTCNALFKKPACLCLFKYDNNVQYDHVLIDCQQLRVDANILYVGGQTVTLELELIDDHIEFSAPTRKLYNLSRRESTYGGFVNETITSDP
ncbi:MAG: hypothetical protein OXR66_06025 [Candidatus Woesearchaeota archaeon]|nr:hypothetical protein [Candidatus Woesearchaeota archaeon]